MVFNSYTFFAFFALVLLLHNLPLPWRIKKFNLLCASYLFYAAWNAPFVLILCLSTVVDWFVAQKIYGARTQTTRRMFLAISLSVNLGLLAFFKYSQFALDCFSALVEPLGISYSPMELGIILPVGISFYTFQTLSYTLDVYFGKMDPWNSFLDFAMFVTFFPQLVAGPIVRAVDFLPQCTEPRRATSDQLGWGFSLIVLGLFQKVVVADSMLAHYADKVFDASGVPTAMTAWMGTLAFAGQIFCDFAGYSTIAIGVAMCLGFKLPDNFRFPYAAVGFSDFWRRWHISLSTWLRDYLYIPLGGNRHGGFRTQINLLLTMLIGGLWHGASWTFVIWGGLHGLYLVVERQIRSRVPRLPFVARRESQAVLGLLTFVLVCITWVFFRAQTLGQALDVLRGMAGQAETEQVFGLGDQLIVFGAMGAIYGLHWLLRNTSLEKAATLVPWPLRSVALVGLMAAIMMSPGKDRAFIYFQF